MQHYRYDLSFVVEAAYFSEAKRLIESRIRRPMNVFKLEVKINGEYQNFQ